MNYRDVCEQVRSMAIQVGGFIRKESEGFSISDIKAKGLHDFVTHVDKGAEERLVDGLKKIVPEAGFITEEGTDKTKGANYNWIIDPLDGTTNFIHKLPPYAISIALMENDQLVVGVVYEIVLDECFYAWREGGAYLNDKAINVSPVFGLSNAFIATGFPYTAFDRMEPFMKTLDYFFRNTPGVRRLGSAATDLAYVACGRFEAFYEYNLKPWDVAAGALIVEEAGGCVSDFKGADDYIFGNEIVATNKAVFNEFLEVVAGFMNQ